jgi:exosome complex RNA-binding protein Csl4
MPADKIVYCNIVQLRQHGVYLRCSRIRALGNAAANSSVTKFSSNQITLFQFKIQNSKLKIFSSVKDLLYICCRIEFRPTGA